MVSYYFYMVPIALVEVSCVLSYLLLCVSRFALLGHLSRIESLNSVYQQKNHKVVKQNWDINTRFAEAAAMLLPINEKLTIGKMKSSRLSCSFWNPSSCLIRDTRQTLEYVFCL